MPLIMQGLSSKWVGCGRAPVHIMANVPRSEALKVLNQEGLLLVLCSLVDNMPYVLAEAAVRLPHFGSISNSSSLPCM